MSPIVTLSPSWSHGPRLVHLVSFRGVAHPTRAHHNPVLHAGEPSRHEPDDDPIALIAHHHGAMTARPLTASRPRVRYLLVVVVVGAALLSLPLSYSVISCTSRFSLPAQPSPVLLFTARRGEDSVKRVPRHNSPCLPDRSALLNFHQPSPSDAEISKSTPAGTRKRFRPRSRNTNTGCPIDEKFEKYYICPDLYYKSAVMLY